VEDIRSKLTEVGPMQNVFIQECELINKLIVEIVSSLRDVELANKGELTMSETLEDLMNNIYLNKVPASWAKFSFETSAPLARGSATSSSALSSSTLGRTTLPRSLW